MLNPTLNIPQTLSNNTPVKVDSIDNIQHGTLLDKDMHNCAASIAHELGKSTKKLTKTEKKFIKWLEGAIKTRKKKVYILDNKKWITATQEELAELFDVSRVTIWQAVKRLEKMGIIEKEKLSERYTDHTYSYTLKGREMTVSNVKNLTNSNNLNNKLFKYKSIINQDVKKSKNKREEIPQEVPQKTNLDIQTSHTGTPVVTIQEMYDVVNEVLGEKLKFRLTKEISRWMGQARNMYFQTLEKWRSFLQAIKRSAYLMGEKFLLTMKWVLRFKTIQKILNGEYESFEERKKQRAEEWNKKLAKEREGREERELLQMQETIAQIEKLDEPESCLKARYNLFKKVGHASYLSWFRDVNFKEEHGKVIMEVASNFKFDWIGNKFREQLENLNIGLRKVTV